jgi:cytidine deaminase
MTAPAMTATALPHPRFQALFAAARDARARAHCPYSRFAVGAAVLDEHGTIHAGCNVENAAYPSGTCAEQTAIGGMVTGGGRRLAAVLVIGGSEDDAALCTPCGACRQRLREFADDALPVFVCGPEGLRLTTTLGDLLPYSFGPANLAPPA